MDKLKVPVLIEIPKDSYLKYEFDKYLNVLRLDRVVKIAYPHNYGFVPDTLWDDGDPLDAFVVSSHAVHPGAVVTAYPQVLVHMLDAGVSDSKLVCTLSSSEPIGKRLTAIEHFLTHYKSDVTIQGITSDELEIRNALTRSKALYGSR